LLHIKNTHNARGKAAKKNLSGIVNGFMIKRLLLPLVGFVFIFSSFWMVMEIKDIKDRQLYYVENLAHHMISYLANCSDDLAHSLTHIADTPGKHIETSELMGFETLFHTIYLLDSRGRVVKSVDEAYYNQDFSGIASHNAGPDTFSLTVPYYSDFTKKIVVGMVKSSEKGRLVLAELNLGSMEQHINEITRFLKNGSVFLTDSYGNVIADVNMALVKQQVNFGNLSIIKTLQEQEKVSGFFTSFGRLKLMSGTLINPGNLKIVVHQNAMDICRPVLWSTLLSLFMLCTLVLFIIAQFNRRVSHAVVHPIAAFAGEIERFKSDSGWDPHLPGLSLSGGKEFRELSDLRLKFSDMQATIANREADLRHSEERYRGLVEDTPVLICRFAQTGEIEFVNHACCDHFSKTVNVLMGSNIFDLFMPLDKNRLQADLRQLSRDRPTTTSEYRIPDSKGKIRWYSWTSRALFSQAGERLTFHCTGEEITKRKEDAEKLAAERERLAVTLRSIGDGVITTDMDGRVVILNKVAETLTGWNQEEARGKPLSTVFHIINETTGRVHDSPLDKVLVSGEVLELANHTVLISRDGVKRIIADSGAPIKDRKSRTIGVVLVFRDMTEKRKLQETLQRTAKIESLGVLAGGIAHDFNNLLGGIFGYIDIVRESAVDERTVSLLQKAMNTIERARHLSSQLLTFAKGSAPVKKAGHLFPFIEECVAFALSGSNVGVVYKIAGDLKACNYDKNQMGQVIDNIVINGKQAMVNGGRMEITAENFKVSPGGHPILAGGDYIKLGIRDTGTGIPKQSLNKIFDPFFSTKEQGHGIGLTTSYSIVEKHGGCIDVESVINQGTCFHIFLPALASAPPVREPEKTTPIPHRGKGRILIMDDENVVVEITTEMLKSLGYACISEKNGDEALALFKAEKTAGRDVTAIICDLTIPGGMGGLELVGEIRKLDPDIPMFVSSGYSVDPVMHDPVKFGFTASISKPFRKSELSEFLGKYLSGQPGA